MEIYKTLEFENKGDRAPRQLWDLPWAGLYHGDMLKKIQQDYPADIVTARPFWAQKQLRRAIRIKSVNMWTAGDVGSKIYRRALSER